MTTAQLRNAAAEAERALNWKLAADLYARAADVYPKTSGQLAALDIAKLRARSAAAREMGA